MTTSNRIRRHLALILPVHDKNKRGKGKSLLPPTTLSVLASLTPTSWDVSIVDENIAEYNKRKEYKKIKEADLVGISIMTPQANRAYKIADDIRKMGKQVVLGGYHVTACPEEAKEHTDAIVIGRAEGIWSGLINDAEEGVLKKEYSSELGKKFINPNKRIQPWLKRKQILPTWLRGYGVKHMTYASVGCNRRCDFCYNSKRKINFTPRDPEEIVKELSQFRGCNIAFCDDNIIGDYKHAKKLFRRIKDLNIKWLGMSCMEIGLPEQKELLELAVKSGCEWLFIGFETLSEGVLGKLNKNHNNPSEYMNAIRSLHSAGIKVSASFMIGAENETRSDIDDIIEFVDKGLLECVDIYFLTPFPGTVMYDRLEEESKLFSKEWPLFDAQHIVCCLSDPSKEELINKFNLLRGEIYSWKSILKRSIFNTRWGIFERCALLITNWFKRRKFARIAKAL